MWLIDATDYTLHEFMPENAPIYAILSHRWDSADQEMTFKDYRKKRRTDTTGYSKIVRFCDLTKSMDIRWAWVDTCCIDKRSSAELTEAINSMWSYYKKAKFCCVYMGDATGLEDWSQSQWWTRGWTLQELLAPEYVTFYNATWQQFASKKDHKKEIETISGISAAALKLPIDRFSIALRMSWAARRTTTRIEDAAYSLLGLFGINMPLLYGEGRMAFRRLQLEILQTYSDESILAWPSYSSFGDQALAPSPAQFQSIPFVVQTTDQVLVRVQSRRQSPLRVTSWGIEFITNARRLEEPLIKLMCKSNSIWAVTLCSNKLSMDKLQCTLVLIQSLYAAKSHLRITTIYGDEVSTVQQLGQMFRSVGRVEEAVHFYLQTSW